MALCPICGRTLGTYTNDPILTNPSLSTDSYKGFTRLLAQHIKELQDERRSQEIANSVTPLTTFTPVDITNLFQYWVTYITELRTSTQKILTVLGISLQDFLSKDEDGNIISIKTNWSDSNLEENKYQCKAIHIEDLRHYITAGMPTIDFPNEINITIVPDLSFPYYNTVVNGSFIFTGIQPDTAIIESYGGFITILNSDAENFSIRIAFDTPPSTAYFRVKYTKGINTYYSKYISADIYMYTLNSGNIQRVYAGSYQTTGWIPTAGWTNEFVYHVSNPKFSRTVENFPPNDLYTYYLLNKDAYGWINEDASNRWGLNPVKMFGDVPFTFKNAIWHNDLLGNWTYLRDVTFNIGL